MTIDTNAADNIYLTSKILKDQIKGGEEVLALESNYGPASGFSSLKVSDNGTGSTRFVGSINVTGTPGANEKFTTLPLNYRPSEQLMILSAREVGGNSGAPIHINIAADGSATFVGTALQNDIFHFNVEFYMDNA